MLESPVPAAFGCAAPTGAGVRCGGPPGPRRAGPPTARRSSTLSMTLALGRSALAGSSLGTTATRRACLSWLPRLVSLLRLALAARLNHRQRNPVALLVNRQNPNGDDVADGYHVIGALDIAIGHLADMDQAAILETDIHEGAEINHVQDGPLEFHSRLEIFQLENALLEDGRRQVFTRITSRACESLQNIIDGR